MADPLAPLHPGELACQLVVSDRPDRVREAMQRRGLPLLNVLGHEVATAASGEAGLQRAAEFAPDLVLLDINMPGLDGFAVAERLRQRSTAARCNWWRSRATARTTTCSARAAPASTATWSSRWTRGGWSRCWPPARPLRRLARRVLQPQVQQPRMIVRPPTLSRPARRARGKDARADHQHADRVRRMDALLGGHGVAISSYPLPTNSTRQNPWPNGSAMSASFGACQ